MGKDAQGLGKHELCTHRIWDKYLHAFLVHNYLEHFFSLSMQFVDERSINFLQLPNFTLKVYKGGLPNRVVKMPRVQVYCPGTDPKFRTVRIPAGLN